MDMLKRVAEGIRKSVSHDDDGVDSSDQLHDKPKEDAVKPVLSSDNSSEYDSADESLESASSLDLVPIGKLQLKDEIRDAIKACGTLNANTFLNNAIEAYAKGGHVMVQTEPGKERFRALAICALDQVNKMDESIQVLVISPFRDDGLEIMAIMEELNASLGYKLQMCAAGSVIEDDRKNLTAEKAQIVIGTPGRIVDLVEKRLLSAECVRLLLIDSAEKLFSRGSKRNANIFVHLQNEVQYVFFVERVTSAVENFIRDPNTNALNRNPKYAERRNNQMASNRNSKRRIVSPDKASSDIAKERQTADHYYVYTENDDKKASELLKLYDAVKNRKVLIMCKSIEIAEMVAQMFSEKKLLVWHKPENSETKMIDYANQFNAAESGAIVAAFENAYLIRDPSVLICYNLPNNRDFLNKWIGALRKNSDKKGVVVTFIDAEDIGRLITKAYRSNFTKQLPENIVDCF